MLPEIANFLLSLGLLFALIQCFPKYSKPAAITSFVCISFAFGALIYSFAVSDFSLKIVFENSHSAKPLIYKISGTWGNHEGSVLMLLFMISFYGIVYSFTKYNKLALSVHGFVTALFASYTKFASNPFTTLKFPMPDGLGLNPLLQDIGLALHPPFLYMGYVGFSLVFSVSIAALWQEKLGAAYAKSARFWTLITWAFLTIGIGLGSSWAYRELGWGGFWFWDPVENASLMPWLSSTALLHSLIITQKRKALKRWTVLLAILTFSFSLIGFFLVRSGVLTSVHSFAADPKRGLFMLGILAAISGLGFMLFAAKAHKLKPEGGFEILSRETGVLFNNMLLITLAATVLVGTIYPLVLDTFGGNKISVGAPYYNYTFTPIALILLVVCGLFSRAKWVHDDINKLGKKLILPACLALAAGLIFRSVEIVAITFLATTTALNMRGKKMVDMPMFLAHTGVAALALGIFFVSSYDAKFENVLKIGEQTKIAGYDVKLENIEIGKGANYVYRRGVFEVTKNGQHKATLKPETRVYPIEQDATTESAIYTHYLNDLYVVIGEPAKEGGYAVRIFYKPLMNLIWLGILVTALGGFLRLRSVT